MLREPFGMFGREHLRIGGRIVHGMVSIRESSGYPVQRVANKPLPVPAAWKNTYFWIAAILFIVGIIGMAKGEAVIRDPGQKEESGLVWIYFAGAVVMLVNGVLSHRQTVALYDEEKERQEIEDAKVMHATPEEAK